MKKMFLMAAFCCTAVLQAQDYYVVTGDNVNVRSQPITGKVVGKVSFCKQFYGLGRRQRLGKFPYSVRVGCHIG